MVRMAIRVIQGLSKVREREQLPKVQYGTIKEGKVQWMGKVRKYSISPLTFILYCFRKKKETNLISRSNSKLSVSLTGPLCITFVSAKKVPSSASSLYALYCQNHFRHEKENSQLASTLVASRTFFSRHSTFDFHFDSPFLSSSFHNRSGQVKVIPVSTFKHSTCPLSHRKVSRDYSFDITQS